MSGLVSLIWLYRKHLSSGDLDCLAAGTIRSLPHLLPRFFLYHHIHDLGNFQGYQYPFFLNSFHIPAPCTANLMSPFFQSFFLVVVASAPTFDSDIPLTDDTDDSYDPLPNDAIWALSPRSRVWSLSKTKPGCQADPCADRLQVRSPSDLWPKRYVGLCPSTTHLVDWMWMIILVGLGPKLV